MRNVCSDFGEITKKDGWVRYQPDPAGKKKWKNRVIEIASLKDATHLLLPAITEPEKYLSLSIE